MADLTASIDRLRSGFATLNDISATLNSNPEQIPPTGADVSVRSDHLAGFQSTDRTGAITLTLDEDAKLVDLSIRDNWTQKLDPSALCSTLLETYSAALSCVLLDRSRQQQRSMPEIAEDIDDGRPDVVPTLDEVIAECRASRHRNENERHRVQRLISPVEPAPPQEVAGQYGYVTLVVEAGIVTSARANIRALENAQTDYLRRDIKSAFDQAGLASHQADEARSGSDEEDESWQGIERG